MQRTNILKCGQLCLLGSAILLAIACDDSCPGACGEGQCDEPECNEGDCQSPSANGSRYPGPSDSENCIEVDPTDPDQRSDGGLSQQGADASDSEQDGAPISSCEILPLDEDLFPALGTDDFETAFESTTNASSANSRALGTADEAVSFSTESAVDTQEGVTPTGGEAPAAEREIVEADIVQMHGDILYALNSFRGLILIDMSQPDSPLIIGRLPFQAQPLEMYLQDQMVYIVMSDYFTYWQFDADADPLGFHGSRVLIADVQDPTAPVEVGSFNLDGEVTDTRIVGDVLYAVSHRNPEYWQYDTEDWRDTTWVASLNIADPANLYEVDRVEFTGSANVVQVYQTALSVAAIDPNYYLVDDQNMRETKITYVDISDPEGDIHVGGSSYVPGAVADKFKMDLYDQHLRVISQDYYWQPNSAAVLTVIDASDSDQLNEVAQIPIEHGLAASNNARIAATRFSGSRMLANICWYSSSTRRQVCRVDFYDLSQHDDPTKADEISIDGMVTHFEPRGDRMLSLGRYWQTNGSRVQIALFDISDISNAQQLSVVNVGERYASSSALGDYKAFKVLDELNMILIPLDWSTGSGSTHKYHRGAQIIDYIDDTLVERGRFDHGNYVTRAIAFQDRVIAISERQIQVVNADDRDNPVVTANLYLIRHVMDVFNIQGYQVQLATDEEEGDLRFYVLQFGEDDMADSIAELRVEGTSHHRLRDGDMIHMIGLINGDQVIRTADFSDPENPRWRGDYTLSDDVDHIYGGGWGFYDYYWNRNAGLPLNNQLIPATVREVIEATDGRRFYDNHLRVIDLRDPDNPRLADGSIEMNDHPFVNRVDHGEILYSTHTEPAYDQDGNKKKYHVKYYLDRVDVSDPDDFVQLPKLNIPGKLVDVDGTGTILYTVDYQWDDYGRRRNSLMICKIEDDKAVLKAVLPVGDEIGRVRYTDRELWLAAHKYPWFGMNDDSPDSRQPYTQLTKIGVAEDGSIESDASALLNGYHFYLLDVEDDNAYLSSNSPYGLLILNVSNASSPVMLNASRSIGYISKVVRDNDYLYMPMGNYGVRRSPLTP